MHEMWRTIKVYEAFIRKSGLVEMLRREVREIIFKGAESVFSKIKERKRK